MAAREVKQELGTQCTLTYLRCYHTATKSESQHKDLQLFNLLAPASAWAADTTVPTAPPTGGG